MDFEDEDLIAVEDMVVTVTAAGYVKRTPLDTYRAQRRGGKGRAGMSIWLISSKCGSCLRAGQTRAEKPS